MVFDGSDGQGGKPEPERMQPNVDVMALWKNDVVDKVADKTASLTGSKAGDEEPAGAMTAEQLADSLIKNNGFGKGADRSNAEAALLQTMQDALQKGNGANRDFVKQVNEDLAKKGSDLRLKEQGGGGGGRSGGGDSYQEHSQIDSKFTVTNGRGAMQDGMKLEASKDTVVEKGKVVGERSEVRGERGGGGGGWGKGVEQQDRFKLHDLELYGEDPALRKTTGGGPGRGGKGGGGPGSDH
jgi:hypothetical protein